ncbi:MAG: hypothetical protein AAGA72_12090 [Pseudomonadota bacterium]
MVSAKLTFWDTFPEKWKTLLSRSYRILLAFVGAYLLTSAFIGALGRGLSALGMSPGEATYTGLLLGMLLFCGCVVWVAATKYIVRLSVLIVALTGLLNFFISHLSTPGA